MSSHYNPNVPGQYPTPQPTPVPPKKKMPLGVKILIGVLGVPAFVIGGCTAILGSSGLAQQAADKAPVGVTTTYDPGINTPEPTKAPRSTHKPGPTLTEGQRQAIGSAKSYLEMQGFSRAGLIRQLTSQYGEGFSKADATYAVDHITVDWNEQAARSAKEYLQVQNFSRAGLIRQLTSQYGGGYTQAQAVYGVEAAGL